MNRNEDQYQDKLLHIIELAQELVHEISVCVKASSQPVERETLILACWFAHQTFSLLDRHALLRKLQ